MSALPDWASSATRILALYDRYVYYMYEFPSFGGYAPRKNWGSGQQSSSNIIHFDNEDLSLLPSLWVLYSTRTIQCVEFKTQEHSWPKGLSAPPGRLARPPDLGGEHSTSSLATSWLVGSAECMNGALLILRGCSIKLVRSMLHA